MANINTPITSVISIFLLHFDISTCMFEIRSVIVCMKIKPEINCPAHNHRCFQLFWPIWPLLRLKGGKITLRCPWGDWIPSTNWNDRGVMLATLTGATKPYMTVRVKQIAFKRPAQTREEVWLANISDITCGCTVEVLGL